MKIGFQGDIGSYAEKATQKFIKQFDFKDVEQIPLITSKNVVSALSENNIDYGVMAIENSTVGEVAETKDALNESIELVAKNRIPIHHCIFTKAPNTKVLCVASHIQALKQTVNTRKKIFSEIKEVECTDTALAAKMLHDGKYPKNYAVICHKNTGKKYGLYLLKENIEDKTTNKTTFGLFCVKKHTKRP